MICGSWISKNWNKLILHLLENTQSIQNELLDQLYDALIEQNAMYLNGKTDLDLVKNNSKN